MVEIKACRVLVDEHIAQLLGYKYNAGQGASYTDGDLNYDGKVDFLDTSITSNGRGVVLRKYIKGTGEGIDLEKANKIVFITRRNDVVPVCARLTDEQAAAYFMLGESIETSAGDPTKAGQAKREVVLRFPSSARRLPLIFSPRVEFQHANCRNTAVSDPHRKPE